MAFSTQLSIWVLRHPLVGAVLVFEIHDRRPIVGEILGVSACCATTLLANVTFHAGIESISADNLMNVGGRDASRFDERI